MALNIPSLTLPSGVVITNSYGVIKIASVTGNNIRGTVGVYLNEAAYKANKPSITLLSFVVPDATKLAQVATAHTHWENLVASVYAYLPSLPAFKGAVVVA